MKPVLMPHPGRACQPVPLYLPHRRVQRLLLARGLAPGRHTFRISLEQGTDPEHKFANPEMPMLGGMQTIHLAGVTPARRLAVYGLEALTGCGEQEPDAMVRLARFL